MAMLRNTNFNAELKALTTTPEHCGGPLTDPWPGVNCNSYGRVYSLQMSGFGLVGALPEEFACFRDMMELDLSNNEITSVPNLSDGMPLVWNIDFSNTLIASVDGFPNFFNSLNMSGTPGNAPVAGLSGNTVRTLDLSNTGITSYPTDITVLDLLDLSGNDLATVPIEVFATETVNLTNSNVATLPSGVAGSSKFVYLDSNPTLSDFGTPTNLLESGIIRTLSLKNCGLTTMPFTPSAFLHTLVLSHNAFTDFPDLSTATGLYDYDISYNSIGNNPNPQPNSAVRVTFEHNSISTPVEFTAAEEVRAGHNQFTTVPVSATSVAVQKIYADNCLIPSVDVSGFPALTLLDLSYNPLTAPLHASAIAVDSLYLNGVDEVMNFDYSAGNFQHLALGDNGLSALTAGPPATIISLDVSQNNLNEVPVAWLLPELQVLNASYNVLPGIPDGLADTDARQLDLSSNPLGDGLDTSFYAKKPNALVFIANVGVITAPDASGIPMFSIAHNKITEWPKVGDFKFLNVSQTCLKGSPPFSLLTTGEIDGFDVRCTYLEDGDGFTLAKMRKKVPGFGVAHFEEVPDYTKDYTACPMLNCPNACEPGEYEKDTFNNCVPCLDGHKCPDMELMSMCTSREYQPDTGKTFCMECNLLNQITNADRTTCTNCTVGTLADATGEACTVLCGAGSYMEGAVCTTCPEGHKCPGDGYKYLCPGGFYQPATGKAACEACGATQYSDATRTECNECEAPNKVNADHSLCGPCMAAGLYTNDGKCRSCERGFKCPGDDTRVACGAGEYSDTTSASVCKLCPAGTVASADHSTCVAPPADKYQPSEGGEAQECGAGFYILGNECLPCPYDHDCPGDGIAHPHVSDCDQYTDNKTLLIEVLKYTQLKVPSVADNMCFLGGISCMGDSLEEGFSIWYTDKVMVGSGGMHPDIGCFGPALTGFTINTPSKSDSYEFHAFPASFEKLTSLKSFRVTGVSNFVGTLPTETLANMNFESFSVSGTNAEGVLPFMPHVKWYVSVRDTCVRGPLTSEWFDPVLNDLSCDLNAKCTVIHDTDDWKAEWVAGNTSDATAIVTADPTTECHAFDLDRCNPCAPGFYLDGSGFACAKCLAGSFCVDGISTQCPAGTYSTEDGATECTPCAAGTWSEDVGRSTECDAITAGMHTYSDPVHPGAVMACGAGSYTNAARDGCETCPIGSFCAGGDAPPAACDAAGQYQDWTNQSLCLACDGIVNADHTACVNCVPGEYINGVVCDDCPVGKFSDVANAASCSTCAVGYTSEAGATGCVPIVCSEGRYLDGSECKTCLDGEYLDGTCKTCPANTFATAGATECTSCAVGSSSEAGAASCTPILCEAGQFLNLSTCETCPAGTYAHASDNSCTQCAEGYASPAGASACQPCAGFGDAQFCKEVEHPEFGTVLVPQTCPDGSYITGDDRQVCKKCSADYKCDGTTKHEFQLAPFTSVDPTTASGFLTLLVIVIVLVALAGGTMFGLAVKKRARVTKPVDGAVGELIVI